MVSPAAVARVFHVALLYDSGGGNDLDDDGSVEARRLTLYSFYSNESITYLNVGGWEWRGAMNGDFLIRQFFSYTLLHLPLRSSIRRRRWDRSGPGRKRRRAGEGGGGEKKSINIHFKKKKGARVVVGYEGKKERKKTRARASFFVS